MKFLEKNKKTIPIILISIILIGNINIFTIDKLLNQNHSQNKNPKDPNTSFIDSDNDSISDEDEINIYNTDPLNKDSDNDGINDNEEIELGTNGTTPDTDGDGLLDGTAQYFNSKEIAPIDPEPLVANGPKGIWQKQIEIEKTKNIPYYLTTFYEYNIDSNFVNKIDTIDWEKLKNSDNLIDDILQLPILKEIASKFLMFRLDNGGTVLHSQTNKDIYDYLMSEAKKNLPNDKYIIFQTAIKTLKIEENLETWQKQFGFNNLYDEVFRIATNNNMQSAQFYFNDSSGNDYALWIWRGYYLALGSGAEMGLYKRNTTESQHWDAVNFEVPMTLNLYNYYSENNIEHIFSWKPQNNQWWITGFNTNYPNVDVTKQVIIGSINFSEHKDMYNSLKEQTLKNNNLKDFIIFDDTKSTIWICWYDK